MDHLMIDLETLGVGPTAAFPSIAAVQFDLNTGLIGETFYRTISLESLFKAGLTVDAGTLKWWMEQDREVCKLMFVNVSDLEDVLAEFTNFIYDRDIQHLWGNSAKFDLQKVETAFQKSSYEVPWNRHMENCYRTYTQRFEHMKWFTKDKPINAHDPRVDCNYQIEKLCTIQSHINAALKLYGEATEKR